jgi:hypothetical protein
VSQKERNSELMHFDVAIDESVKPHEIHIMPTSFLVRAKDSAGNPVGSIWKMPAVGETFDARCGGW